MRLRLAVMTRIENCQPYALCIKENEKFTKYSQIISTHLFTVLTMCVIVQV